MQRPVGQTYALQRFKSYLPPPFFGHVSVKQRKLHIFQCGKPIYQIEALKNKAYLNTAYLAQLLVGKRGHVLSVKKIAPRCGQVQTAQNVHQRGLSRAARSHHRDILTVPYLKAYPVQRRHALTSNHIILTKIGSSYRHKNPSENKFCHNNYGCFQREYSFDK